MVESDRELISITEFNENFKGKRIQVLWPDTGKWYNADVIKVNVAKRTAKLFYVDSEEKEDINLYEAMLNMEVSWPYKGGSVGKTPAAADKKRKQRDESTSASESASEDDAPRAKKKTGAVAARRAQIKKQQKQRNAGPAGPSDATRRLIAEKLKAVMVVASGELNATDAKSASDPERVADDVERAAHVLFAEDVKKYNDKARSLHFNLNHPKNHALRARVLTGALQPEALVRMTGPELAPPDLQEMRREREARVGEDAFLAAGPATRLVKTSKGEQLVVVGGGDIEEEGDGLGNRQEETLAQQAAARAAAQAARRTAGPDEVAETPRAVPAPPELTTFEAFAAGTASSDEDGEGAPAENAGADARDDVGDDDEYDPAEGFDDADAADAAPERAPADADAKADAKADADAEPSPSREVAAKAREGAPSPAAPGTWTGTLKLSGLGGSRWRAAAADGERAPFESVLPDALEIKGRVQFQETNEFLGQVFEGRSKTRGVTVGVGAPVAAGDEFARKLTAAYREKERYGLIKGGKRGGDWELYLVPQGKLSARLLKVFKTSRLDEAALAEQGTSAMLWCVVHAKGLGPNVRAKRQPSARSVNETVGFKGEADEDEAGGTPPGTIPQAYQSTMPVDPYVPGNEHTAFAPFPQGAFPAPQYGAPPHAAFMASVPPPPPRADRAEDFLNATFGAPPPGAVRSDVPPPPFARVADVPPPPFKAPPYPILPPDPHARGSGLDRRDDRYFRENDRYLPPTRASPSAGGARGEPPCLICRDLGFTRAMQTHATEQHARRSDRDAFHRGPGGRGRGGRESPRGGRGGRGGPFGSADDSPRGGWGGR